MSTAAPPGAPDNFFEAAFLAELEELAAGADQLRPEAAGPSLHDKLASFLAPGTPGAPLLDEEGFVSLPGAALAGRTDLLLEICRGGLHVAAVHAVENFVVFFQALLPTLPEEGARQVRRFFFRLAPTLIQIAHHDFGERQDAVAEGRAALANLETILIEVSDVRLAPAESELVFRSLDQLASFIAVGEFAVASKIVSAQLLDIIERNKLSRALYRLMEAETAIQAFMAEHLGYRAPQIGLPEDLERLRGSGPIRVLEEESPAGEPACLILVEIPGLSRLGDVVLHLISEPGAEDHALRLDALGTAVLALPPGRYRLGLAYEPLERRSPAPR